MQSGHTRTTGRSCVSPTHLSRDSLEEDVLSRHFVRALHWIPFKLCMSELSILFFCTARTKHEKGKETKQASSSRNILADGSDAQCYGRVEDLGPAA